MEFKTIHIKKMTTAEGRVYIGAALTAALVRIEDEDEDGVEFVGCEGWDGCSYMRSGGGLGSRGPS